MIDGIYRAFFSLFIILDVVGNVPLFWSMVGKAKKADFVKQVNLIVIVASAILLAFLFFGMNLLAFFGISIKSFQIAGGLILLFIGLEMALGISIGKKKLNKLSFSVVPLSTPALAGPGVLATVVLLVQSYGVIITLIAAVLNMSIVWLVIRFSKGIYSFLGEQGSSVLERIMGLILTAIAIELLMKGFLF